jgi:aspartate carbamoyltransferase catalytic subunit
VRSDSPGNRPRPYNPPVTTAPTRRPAPARTGATPAADPFKLPGLLGLAGLHPDQIRLLLARTHAYAAAANDPAACTHELNGRLLATMFFEDSTRTRTSFTLAARRLGADTIDLSSTTSSVNKGETLIDTALTIQAMGISAMVVRTRQAGGPALIASAVRCPVINAGDGRHEHPTQGLLDLYTIAHAHGRLDGFDFSGLTLAIIGDVANSRVARSAISGLRALGGRAVCIGPPALAPASLRALGCDVSRDLDEVLPHADAVMMLRIQFERHGEKPESAAPHAGKPPHGQPPHGQPPQPPRSQAIPSIREYRELYALTSPRAARMKPGAIVMHPGPMNRGVEIDGPVADGPRSAILRQVAHGVAARMAVLSACLG